MIQSIDHIYKPTIISRVALLMLFFVYMFSIQFVFVPGGIGTRALAGICGIFFFLVDKLPWLATVIRTGVFKVNKFQFSIGLSLLMIAVLAFIVNMFNGTSERTFLTYPISMFLIIGGAYMVSRITQILYKELKFEIIANYVVGAVLLQVYISLAMFFSPEMKQLIAMIVLIDGNAFDMLLNEDGFRLLGLGVMFFAAGIVNSFALILICQLLRNKNSSRWRIIYLTFAFVSILSLGMMMARTTLIGACLGFGMVLLNIKFFNSTRKTFKRVVFSSMLLSALVFLFVKLMPADNRDLLNNATEYGFEMFYNYFEDGQMSTASSDELKNMYDVYPQSFKTWLIGDGLFADPINYGSYYMGIDVGYLRLIFYFGLIGLTIFLFYQVSILWYINHKTRGAYLQFLLFVYIFMLVGNVKGFTDMTYLFALFLYLPDQNKPYRALTH